jgi:trehalose/maltose hydrolase-like predicted phosphorylase
LALNPRLLPHWRRLAFPLEWRGRKLRISAEPERILVDIDDGREAMRIGITGGPEIVASPRKQYISEPADNGWGNWREAGI